ncbi:FecCD family ABC transporter permease [Nitrospira moscoviensis]|uniref:Vitamin B12 import system, permease protein BtuC n=1 Tax=Nitrospira moscoviensis TaxID=42253 RepID=A0A0K2GBC7_NITMO|nr:iron ABC transporter permease [Nitrospira moscoviensis]ALA58248.1 Vitamin B12 import system, permease protein BtuC [Nitrospira moscoviensis]
MIATEPHKAEPITATVARKETVRGSLSRIGDARLTRGRWWAVLASLSTTAVLLLFVSLQFGTQWIGLGDIVDLVMRALREGRLDHDAIGTAGVILFQVRLPRVLLGFLVGACLAAVGVVLQALLRNPLADPYVLGVSSGAALGVALAILLGIGTTVFELSALPLCGFAGGLLSLVVVYRMAASYGRLPIHSLLLAGVILNAILSAVIMFITSIMEPNRAAGVMTWLLGNLTAPSYPALAVLALYLIGGMLLLLRQAPALNVLTLGEESARSLGVETEGVKRAVYALSALITGAVVSMSGMIGFVGMMVPHAVRLLLGVDHRLLLPASALAGGMLLMVADTVARTLLSPSEIPVGIITALAGGPFFIYLLAWRRDRLL